MSDNGNTRHAPPPHARAMSPSFLVVVIVLGCVASASSYALLTLAIDGLSALAIVVPAILAGLWFVPARRLPELPLRWHLLLAATFGLGALSIAVLLCGLLGLLQRPLWVGLLLVAFIAGIVRLQQLVSARTTREDAPRDPFRWLWVALTPFIVLAILAAVHAPGFLWSEEGAGYDALEYHLALPKEYRQQGRIDYTPHNVYGNFPANVEMLYLTAMVVLDEDVNAGTTTHMVHLLLGALTIFAAYVAGREWSRRAGVLSAILAGTCTWWVYLSGLAFVENGMLFFGMAAAAVVARALRVAPVRPDENESGQTSPAPWRWYAVAGAAAGLACGCKYTAVPMIALPIACTAFLAPTSAKERLTACLAALVACGVTFSPWLIKNTVMTGNPVFPLANQWFQATPPGWDMVESAHWDECHSAMMNASKADTPLHSLWTRVLADHYGRFGPLLFAMALAGCLVRRLDRVTLALLLLLIVQVGVWLFATHLYARFAVVLVIPLALLGGRAAFLATTAPRTTGVIAVTALGAAVNFAAMLRLYRAEAMPGAIAPASLIYNGVLPWYGYLHQVNDVLARDARVLVLGDAKAFYYRRSIAYCVVFNRDPFVEAIEQNPTPPAIGQWLKAHRFTHVLVHYGEIERLRRSAYGFPESVNRELFDRLEQSGILERIVDPEYRGRSVVLYAVR